MSSESEELDRALDIVRTGGLAILSTLDVIGGPLTVVVDHVLPSAHLRRLEEGLRWVRDDVIMLQGQVDDRLLWKEEFGEFFEHTAGGIARASSARKRRAFAAMLGRGLVGLGPSHERRMFFVDLLERCRDSHLTVLAMLAEDRAADHRMISEVIEPENVEIANLAGNDLFNWGLRWVDDSVQADRKVSEWAAAGLTPLGQEFVEFIKTPDSAEGGAQS